MRIALWADMEGMSRVVDHRQCWPAFEEYWTEGRDAFTDEVVAAATGLIDGGAHEVYVVNAHGLGWPNLLWDELPDGAAPADDRAYAEGFDAAFQVGFHARAGTPGAFMSHTMVPGLKVAADGAPLTECHIWAWLDELPLLGVSGDAALGDQIDGFLAGTPFAAVKRATGRGAATPLHPERTASLAALTDFARGTVRSPTRPLDLPSEFTFEVALEPHLADQAEGQAGLTRRSPEVLGKRAQIFARDAYPALQAAMGAALQPLFAAQGDLDLSSEAVMQRQDKGALARCRDFFDDWAQVSEPAWPQQG